MKDKKIEDAFDLRDRIGKLLEKDKKIKITGGALEYPGSMIDLEIDGKDYSISLQPWAEESKNDIKLSEEEKAVYHNDIKKTYNKFRPFFEKKFKEDLSSYNLEQVNLHLENVKDPSEREFDVNYIAASLLADEILFQRAPECKSQKEYDKYMDENFNKVYKKVHSKKNIDELFAYLEVKYEKPSMN